MPLFAYRAYDDRGAAISGSLEAPSAGEARERLQKRGLLPFELEEEGAGSRWDGRTVAFSLAERQRFTRQLAALLRGGVPLARALAALEAQDAWRGQRRSMIALREAIERGSGLSMALETLGNVLDQTACATVKVGETTGSLAEVFQGLAEHFQRRMEQRRRLIGVLAYPAITMTVSLAVLVFVMVYLVPTVSRLFSHIGDRLPWLTRVLIAVSNILQAHGPLLAVLLIGSTASVAMAWRIAAWRSRILALVAHIPGVGAMWRDLWLEGWARNMSLMLRSGVALLPAVTISQAHAADSDGATRLTQVEKALERGETFAGALRTAEFPAFLRQMVEAGEASGDLGGMLELVADDLDADNRARTELLLNILEPILIIVMGVVVGGIMVAVLLPMYDLNRLI